MTERFGLRVAPVPPRLVASDYGVYEIEVTVCGVQHGKLNHEVAFVLLQSFRHFPYNENPTRAPNNTLIKC